jgi:hypothetical protein
LWYNEGMSESEIIVTPDVVSGPDVIPQIKRMIASSLAAIGEQEAPYFSNADKMTKHRDILATILWDIVTNGSAWLADGTVFKPESYSDWLSTVKYLVTHLDGPVGGEEGLGTNVFKVYVGVNIDKI